MAHITSSWAAAYCLEDPARHADAIFAADGSAAREAGHVLTAIAAAAQAADHPLGRARRTVAGAWSAEQPCAAATRLVDAHADTAHACTAIAAVATRVVWIITAAHTAARQAYADADAAILARDLLHYRQELGTYPGWDLPTMIITEAERQRVDSGRRTVVATLNAVLSATYRELDSEAADAGRSLEAAPWEALPTAAQPALAHVADERNQTNLAALHADLSAPSGPRHALALTVDRALRRAAAAGQTAQLLVYDPMDPPGQGSVAIAIGDVDAASSVAVIVPGITNSPAGIGDSIAAAVGLNDAVIDKAGADKGTSATVLWWGYDIPLSYLGDVPPRPDGFTFGEIVRDTAPALGAYGADVAGERLAAFIGTLRPAMPAAAGLTLIGFSWGSIVASEAARMLGKEAGLNHLVTAGSPGAGYHVSTAKDYRAVDAADVYVMALPGDPVPMDLTDEVADFLTPHGRRLRKEMLGYDPGPYGPDPASPGFGANVIAVRSEHTSKFGIDFGAHSLENYLDGDARTAIAAVIAGQEDDVPLRRPR